MKNKIGNSEVFVSPLTLGTFAIGGFMWGGNERKDSIEAIQTSIDNGITSIDTAPVYGFGLSEQIVGEAIKNHDRSKVEILTKFGLVWGAQANGDFFFDGEENGNKFPIYRNGKKESVIREVEASLKRLQTDYIDLIQLHWPDPETPIAETMEAMQRLMEQGKVKAIGVSNYNTDQLGEALKTTIIHSNQVSYSMLNRSIENELIPFSMKNNIGIIAYSPLERGLLTGKYTNGTATLSDTDHRNHYFGQYDPAAIKALLKVLSDIASANNCSVTQLVLAWTIKQPGITTVLGGARNKEQAKHNAAAMQLHLKEDDLTTIQQYLHHLKHTADNEH